MELDFAHGREPQILRGSSVASCAALSDPDFEFARRLLGEKGTIAYELILAAVGGAVYLETTKHELIPIGDSDVLSDSTFYYDLLQNEPTLKLQKEFLELANEKANKTFVTYVEHTDTSEKILLH